MWDFSRLLLWYRMVCLEMVVGAWYVWMVCGDAVWEWFVRMVYVYGVLGDGGGIVCVMNVCIYLV